MNGTEYTDKVGQSFTILLKMIKYIEAFLKKRCYAKSSKGDKVAVSMDNSQIINLFLNTTSLSQKTDQKQHFIIGFLILLVAIFVGIYKRY